MIFRKQLLLLCLLCIAGASYAQITSLPQIKVLDLDDTPITPLTNINSQTTAVVYIFQRTDCPLSKRYAPEIKRLAEKFAAHNIAMRLIYPGADEGAAVIRQHLQDYEFSMPAWRDPQHALAKFAGVTITPEVAVFVSNKSNWRLVYRGRIDDRVAAFGKMRPAPTVRDLENVLTALTNKTMLKLQTTKAVGCYID